MTSCTPSYTTNTIPIDPAACGPDCFGVTFAVGSVVGTFDGRSCKFVWDVTRSSPFGSKVYTDTTFVACPGSKTITFYCGDDTGCPRFELILTCGDEGGGEG